MSVADFYDLFKKQEQKPRPPAPVDVPAERASSYATAALRREAEIVAAATEGHRNETLNKAAVRMGRHIGANTIDLHTVKQTLANAARTCGLPESEIELVLRENDNGGLVVGQADPRYPSEQDTPPVTVLEPDGQTLVDFWTARGILAHIHAFARARRTSPWAVLGVALCRIATATPHFVVLPALVGGHASLNTFLGLVGPSGSGKGAAEAAAADAVDVGHIEVHTTGSGEGIAHAYMRREKGEIVQHSHAALFSVPEIDTLTALGDRRGATLLPELRRAWSGERLGFAYADPTRRLPIPAGSYRLCLVAGIQPGRARALLDDTDGGTPQRFLWLPATDPDAPDTAPPCPDPIKWAPPGRRLHDEFRNHAGNVVMRVCADAQHTIDAARLARIRGEGDALDGHALLARLKVAAVLAVADGRLDVNDEDWRLSDVIATKSAATRARVAHALQKASRDANTARALAEADRVVTVGEKVTDAAVKRVCGVVARRLGQVDDGEWTPVSQVRRWVSSRDRQHFTEALDRLGEAGQIETREGAKGEVIRAVTK